MRWWPQADVLLSPNLDLSSLGEMKSLKRLYAQDPISSDRILSELKVNEDWLSLKTSVEHLRLCGSTSNPPDQKP